MKYRIKAKIVEHYEYIIECEEGGDIKSVASDEFGVAEGTTTPDEADSKDWWVYEATPIGADGEVNEEESISYS